MSWQNRKRQFQQQFVNFLDIPRDIMLDLPKVIVIGDVQVFIENHRGIVVYNSNEVKVRSTVGDIEITGEGLSLKNILPDELVIEGKIFSVGFKG